MIINFILSYERPKALAESIRTVFENTKVRPDMTYILDDNSNPQLQGSLLQFAKEYSTKESPINLILNGGNLGVGHQFETIFRLIGQHKPDIAGIIEGDYFFRKEYYEDILSVFEACPHTVAVPAMDHHDMRLPHKTHGEFIKLMEGYFDNDVENRSSMYREYQLNTNRGLMNVFGVSNSCGAQFLNYRRIQELLFNDLNMEKEFWDNVYQACIAEGNRKQASDGLMSCTITYLWNLWAQKRGIDTSKNFAYVNILPSIAYHAANGGINGKLDPRFFPEGSCFEGVNSGTFPQDYNNWTRETKNNALPDET